MIVFITGGAKNGKSSFAQDLAVKLARGGKRYYIATMIPCDEEDRERIRRHVDSRAGKGFTTIECGVHITDAVRGVDAKGSFLLDSVTALLTNEMFRDGEFDPHAAERVAEELCELADSVGSIVFVSDFIFADTGMYDEFTETYRAGLARCDAALARCCDTVVEINLATPILYKGVMPL